VKITETELNLAYLKVNEIKNSGDSLYMEEEISDDLDRNPLIDENFFDDTEEYVLPFKLKFKWMDSIGPKGSYILDTEVTVIPDDTEDGEIFEN